MLDDNSKNYHSRLLSMSKGFDKPIERLKGSYVDANFTNWISWWLLAPFREYKKVSKVHDGLKKLSAESLTTLTIPFFTIGTTVWQSFLGDVSNFIELVGTTTVGFIIGYLISLVIYWTYLLDFYSDHFHIGAYKVFRNQEYNMFKMALFDNPGDFYFRGMYDYLGRMQTGSEEFSALSDRMTNYFEKDKQQLQLKADIARRLYERQEKRNEEEINKITGEYELLVQAYQDNLDEALIGIEYVIELIKDINNVLFRVRNKVFSSRDLDLVSGFTLHELRGKELHKLEDVGTSGRTPKVLNIDDPKYKDWGVVEVIKGNLKQPVINEPYENHTVVSVKLNIDDSKQWVYNFHFDSDDKKVNHLLVKNDIIDSREVYRLIHALCLISEGTHSGTIKEAKGNG